MKILRILFVLCLFLLLCGIAEARQTLVTAANELRIDLVRYDPSPVQPGAETDIWFEVTNIGGKDLTDLEITLVADYPFTIKSAKTIKFPKLRIGETQEFTYKVYVNKDAMADTYQLSLQYFSEKYGATESASFNVNVRRSSASMTTSIEIESGEFTATAIEPGETADMKFKIKNTADSAMMDITVKLELGGASVPFAPLGMTTEKKINMIAAGKEEEVTYTLIALPDASAGIYKIPVTIQYYDRQGISHNTSDLIGLMIGANPKISLEIDSSELSTKTKTGVVVLKIVNYGTTDIKFMRMELQESADYEVISSSETYIGDVDSDDYETVEFRVKMKKDVAALKVALDYKDANNKAYEEVKEVALKLYSPSELGLATTNWLLRIISILVIVGLYIGYRRWKKRKRQK